MLIIQQYISCKSFSQQFWEHLEKRNNLGLNKDGLNNAAVRLDFEHAKFERALQLSSYLKTVQHIIQPKCKNILSTVLGVNS